MNERFFNYSPPIPPELKTRLEEGMSNVPRWKNGLLLSRKEENDKEHVIDMFGIFGALEYTHSYLYNSVDGNTMNDMFYLHDIGELGAGDLSHSHPDFLLLKPKYKQKEARTKDVLTRRYIKDPVVSQYIQELSMRIEHPEPHDRESHMMHLIDKVQATRFGLEYVFNGKTLTHVQREQQLNHGFDLIITPAKALYPLLELPAQDELRNFVYQEISRFNKHGYQKKETEFYLAEVARILQ